MTHKNKQNLKKNDLNQTNNVFEESPSKLYLQVVLFTLGMGLVGLVTHPFFQALSFSLLNKIEITATQTGTNFDLKVLYIASFLIVPLLVFAVHKLLKLQIFKQKLFLIASIFISGVIFLFIQISSLNQQHTDMLKIQTPFPMKYSFALESLFFEFNLLVGFIVGAIFAAVSLYRFNKLQKENLLAKPNKLKK